MTPVHTSSGRLKLGLERCPACLDHPGKSVAGEKCFYCDGGRCVSIPKAAEWRAAHRDTDPAPPSTEKK